MFHYKTSFCPINHIDHDRSLCVYAHNWQDYRRKPNKHYIEPEVCPDWDNTKIVLNYEEGCPRGLDCQFCHGWKEPEYHPFVYKTKKCESSAKECQRLNACPYYHSSSEKRVITDEDRLFFEFVPSTRVTQGTYKVFIDQDMYGVTPENEYIEDKNDKKKFDSMILSMTSLNLHPMSNEHRSLPVFPSGISRNQIKRDRDYKGEESDEDSSDRRNKRDKVVVGPSKNNYINKLGMMMLQEDDESQDTEEDEEKEVEQTEGGEGADAEEDSLPQ